MYCYQGKEHFCSILFTSQKPENGKTTLVECLLGDPENSELMLFYCFLSFLKKKRTNVNFRGSGGEKRNSSSYRSLVSWIDTILGGISTFLSVFPKGLHQATWLTSACQRHPGASLPSIYKWNGKPKQPVFASGLHSSGLCFASSKSTDWKGVCVSLSMLLPLSALRPFPPVRLSLKGVSKPIRGLEGPQSH